MRAMASVSFFRLPMLPQLIKPNQAERFLLKRLRVHLPNAQYMKPVPIVTHERVDCFNFKDSVPQLLSIPAGLLPYGPTLTGPVNATRYKTSANQPRPASVDSRQREAMPVSGDDQ
ncbi:uncharacterized protein GLRG_08036 [Colletotrichum graminicola M1.001]|uniref:Uncharacterized protein n=1 Tax=Colletotrichum graminicola (strain M1.001 / M2 / FGSC 10212) TaxID=645133 RepID=E3QPW5_COLGM|nr:uncharacterized protein GLRG_08036 [Colletotrichum graminicola M1.001]EFQ32892.1 hypothetical protein GLRG_08036 [Colletotrichum graminicola M1.001]